MAPSSPLQTHSDTARLTSNPVAADSSAPDALAVLRASTGDMHALLDSQLPIGRDGAGLDAYAQHVSIVGCWLADIDALPIAAADWPAGFAERQARRHQRIAADALDLHTPVACLPLPLDTAAGHPSAQRMSSPGFAWGVAYVVEGSQLGGQMLFRRLREPLAPHPLHYLDGDPVAGQWPRFTAALRSALSTPESLEGACAGAAWAFATLTARFRRAAALS